MTSGLDNRHVGVELFQPAVAVAEGIANTIDGRARRGENTRDAAPRGSRRWRCCARQMHRRRPNRPVK